MSTESPEAEKPKPQQAPDAASEANTAQENQEEQESQAAQETQAAKEPQAAKETQSTQEPQATNDLQRLFPDLQSLETPPPLVSYVIFGTGLFGKRAEHWETNSYVSTLYLTVLFVPLLALRAYRVSEAPGDGWHFLGRVPLSKLAMLSNALLLFGTLAGAGGWWLQQVANDPARQIEEQLKVAQEEVAKGRLGQALQRLTRMSLKGKPFGAQASQIATTLLKEQLPKASPKKQQELFSMILVLPTKTRERLFPTWHSFAAAFIKTLAKANDPKALKRCHQLAHIWRFTATSRSLFERALRQQKMCVDALKKKAPKAIEWIVAAAQIEEQLHRCRGCWQMLSPHQDQLGATEGARLLGVLALRRQKEALAQRLLMPYVKKQLAKLQVYEERFQARDRIVRARAIKAIEERKAPKFLYSSAFRSLGKREQTKRIIHYVRGRLAHDIPLQLARWDLQQTSQVVPVAIELGMLTLRRARRLPHTQKRKALQKVEKLFLQIHGAARENTSYQLTLGQVYFWLGKQRKGQALFDQVLKAQKRHPKALLMLASVQREVGNRLQAQTLSEEAYHKASHPQLKRSAAVIRALTATHIDDKILWLKRCDLRSPGIAALLANAQGNKAWQQGDNQRAAQFYQKAIRAYERLKPSPSSLNNSALAYLALFRVTGKRQAFEKGLARLKKAIQMRPGDSILLANAADTMRRAMILDLVAKEVKLDQLRLAMHLGLLDFLHSNEKEYAAIKQKLLAHPIYREMISLYKKVLLLAPNNATVYEALAGLYRFLGQAQELQALKQLTQQATFDTEEDKQQTLAAISGRRDRYYQRSFRKELAQLQRVAKRVPKSSKVAYAIIRLRLVHQTLAASAYGVPYSAKDLLSWAQEAYALAPSYATREALARMWLLQLAGTLKQQYKPLRLMLRRCRRTLSSRGVLLQMLLGHPMLRKQAQALPSLKKALSLMEEQAKASPSRLSVVRWVLLRVTTPRQAIPLGKQIKQSTLLQAYRAIQQTLHPYQAAEAMLAYWTAIASAQPKRAQAIKARFARQHIPIAFE